MLGMELVDPAVHLGTWCTYVGETTSKNIKYVLQDETYQNTPYMLFVIA